jgi:hypothetical protein
MKALARVLVFSGAALATGDAAVAQTPAAPPPTISPTTPAPPRGTAQRGTRSTTPTETPPPGAQSSSRAYVQGFSIVLVLGDLQAATATDDVPMAARKALSDMREFLPFKSYKLLDAAWVLCCGQDARREAPRGLSMRDVRAVKQILRGPDGQEFEVELRTYRTEGNRIFVGFSLESPRSGEDASVTVARTEEIAELNRKKMTVERELVTRASAGEAKTEDYSRLQAELQSLNTRLGELRTRTTPATAGQRRSTFHETSKPLIDTSFTMDVGETVVVGTSRMKGAPRALIALLTAVPPRSGERRE